jgi:hypothetical protein
MKQITFVNTLILAFLVWLPSASTPAAGKASVSATIQATARVVPSQGIAVSLDEKPSSENHTSPDLNLWLTESEDLQVQVEADGRPIAFRLTRDEVDISEMSVLDRHRCQGLSQQRLQLEPSVSSADSCTITIVNPTN